MASKKTVTLDNLAALGSERLAAILVDLAETDAEVKRRLRLKLAAQVGGDTVAAEIGKRITSLGRYVTFQMAEVAMSGEMFADILMLVARLRAPPAPA
jgi:hypothetical protein